MRSPFALPHRGLLPSATFHFVAALMLLAGCGPACPRPFARRADLPPDLAAGERRLVLDANSIGQVNVSAPVLRVRIEGIKPAALRFSVYDAARTRLLEVDVTPEPDGVYRIPLPLPGGKPLGAGVYRLHAAPVEPLEASFEVRECTVYY
jgi:hypothetical protein